MRGHHARRKLGRGSDLGYRFAFSQGYFHEMTLNDTRISEGFVAALLDPRLPADAGIVAPVIDHGFPNEP
jgi:hypothetical protein